MNINILKLVFYLSFLGKHCNSYSFRFSLKNYHHMVTLIISETTKKTPHINISFMELILQEFPCGTTLQSKTAQMHLKCNCLKFILHGGFYIFLCCQHPRPLFCAEQAPTKSRRGL